MHDARDQQHSNSKIKLDATILTYTRIRQANCDLQCMHTRHLVIAPPLLAAVVLRPYLSTVGER